MKRLPVIELNELTIYPTVSVPLLITDANNVNIVKNNSEILITKSGSDYAVSAKVVQHFDINNGQLKVELLGLEPCKILDRSNAEYGYELVNRTLTVSSDTEENITRVVSSAVASNSSSHRETELIRSTLSSLTIEEKFYYSVQLLDLNDAERESVLKNENLNASLLELLTKVDSLKIDQEVEQTLMIALKDDMEKSQKEYILRQKKEAIEKELGEDDENEGKIFKERLEKCLAPEDIKLKIKREIKRYNKLPAQAGEKGPLENYIRTMLDMPWGVYSTDDNSLTRAEEILDEHHYGMTDVKERILEYLAVKSLTKNDGKGTILCLAGAPGVGKTSIATSLAESLGRTFQKVSLGGVNDESAIRGHRRTYVGSMPGKIVAAIKKAGTSNPVILLDEIDKMASDTNKGDPSAAMLEVLDPAQNSKFNDHYLDCEFDLSQVVFIATANYLNKIPAALKDRLEIINLSGYTVNEKVHIANNHLITRAKNDNGLGEANITANEDVMIEVIKGYTREAGVRNLQRAFNTICRKLAVKSVKDNTKIEHHTISKADVREFLGVRKFSDEQIEKKNQVGVVNGMYYSEAGGGVLPIEVITVPGKGKVQVTGNLKDVMKESSSIAMSYVRSVAKSHEVGCSFFEENDFCIHAGDGSTPKDGPSAGITMSTALISAITGQPINRKLAMTGEVNLRGNVLPIGGVKEKILGAKLAGCDTIIIPKKNEKDLEEISDEIKEGLKIIACSEMSEVLEIAFK